MSNFAVQNEAQKQLSDEQEDVIRGMRRIGSWHGNVGVDPTDETVIGNIQEDGIQANVDVNPEAVEVIGNIQEQVVQANDAVHPLGEEFYYSSKSNQDQPVPVQHDINQGDQMMLPVNAIQPALLIPPQATSSVPHVLYHGSSDQQKLPSPKSLACWATNEQDYLCVKLYLTDVAEKIQAMVSNVKFHYGFGNGCPYDGAYSSARYMLSLLYPTHYTYGPKGIYSFHLPFSDFKNQFGTLDKYHFPSSYSCSAPRPLVERVARGIRDIVFGLNFKYGLQKEWFRCDVCAAAHLVLGTCSQFNSMSTTSVQPTPHLYPANSPFHPYTVQHPPSTLQHPPSGSYFSNRPSHHHQLSLQNPNSIGQPYTLNPPSSLQIPYYIGQPSSTLNLPSSQLSFPYPPYPPNTSHLPSSSHHQRSVPLHSSSSSHHRRFSPYPPITFQPSTSFRHRESGPANTSQPSSSFSRHRGSDPYPPNTSLPSSSSSSRHRGSDLYPPNTFQPSSSSSRHRGSDPYPPNTSQPSSSSSCHRGSDPYPPNTSPPR